MIIHRNDIGVYAKMNEKTKKETKRIEGGFWGMKTKFLFYLLLFLVIRDKALIKNKIKKKIRLMLYLLMKNVNINFFIHLSILVCFRFYFCH